MRAFSCIFLKCRAFWRKCTRRKKIGNFFVDKALTRKWWHYGKSTQTQHDSTWQHVATWDQLDVSRKKDPYLEMIALYQKTCFMKMWAFSRKCKKMCAFSSNLHKIHIFIKRGCVFCENAPIQHAVTWQCDSIISIFPVERQTPFMLEASVRFPDG